MAKTKQQKFTDSLRQDQINTFSDGLNMDLHPLTTPNTILTDCVNGTMITYNDNEFVLQNERGNTKIDNAQLSPGFIPVGMKEHNGILYIVSHNPQTKKTEIGTFPSPKQIVNFNLSTFDGNVNLKYDSNYTEYKKDIVWYDYNLSVSNYDKYKITIDNPHPLIALEHFILDKQGNIAKITLNENNEYYRFTHIGEGVLGYKYRPYFLSSISTSVDPVKGAKSAQLVVTITSDDEELWKEVNYADSESEDFKTRRKIEEFLIDYNITITLISDTEDTEDLPIDYSTIINNINTYDWDYTYNLTRTDVINLKSLNSFTLEGTEYKYDFREGVVIKMEENTPSNEKYNKIKFIITPKIQKDTGTDTYTVCMDHLKTELISNVSNVFSQESWFSKFQYQIANESEDDILLDFDIILDLTKYDVNWESYSKTDIKDASYKLSEIDDNGNLIGLSTPIRKLHKSSNVFYPVFDYKSGSVIEGFKGLIIGKGNILSYKNKSGSIETLNLETPPDVTECRNLIITADNKPEYVKYVRENDETYNVELYNADKKLLSKENIYSTLFGDGCLNDMEERFKEDHVKYIAENVKLKKNKIYLFELNFPIQNHTEGTLKREKASFIVVTADYMLTLTEKPDRMDEIQLNEWFKNFDNENEIVIEKDIKTPEYITRSFTGKYKNNTIDLEEISKQDEDAVGNYAKKFFLKYNSLFDNPDSNMVPWISQRIKGSFKFKNTSAFNCLLNLGNTIPVDSYDQMVLIKNGYNIINSGGTIQMKKDFVKKISLQGTPKEYKQTVERKYLWDLFKKDIWNIGVLKGDYGYYGDLSWGDAGDAMDVILSGNSFRCATTKLIRKNAWTGTAEFKDVDWLNWTGKINSVKHAAVYKLRKDCWFYNLDYRYYHYIDDKTGLFGGTLQLMKNNYDGFNGGIYIGEIKGNIAQWAGEKYKLWICGKTNTSYSLVGIDSLDRNLAYSKSAYDAILKHAYYLNDVNKTVYQYIYDEEDKINDSGEKIGSQIKISEETPPTISNIIGSIFPAQCIFINKDYSTYNIQSYNNLNYNNLQNVNLSVFTNNNIVFDEFNDKYSTFLRELGYCLNTFCIRADVLQQHNDSSLYFDYDSRLFDDDNEFNKSYNLFNNEDNNFYKQLNSISNPYLKYDRENNILYTDEIKEDQINQFYYSENCVSPLKWNYSLTFDQFWDTNEDSIDELNKYHSLLFYRYSSYADEEEQSYT